MVQKNWREQMPHFLAVFLLLMLSVSADKVKLNLNGLDGLDALGDLFNGLAGAAKQKKDGTCPSACDGHPNEGSWLPAPKPKIRPYSNGCSVPSSMRDSIGDYSLFEPCCDLHDACYMACGIPKPLCEKQFQKCLSGMCDTKFHSKHQQKRKSDCHTMASMFATGTSMFGCNGYHELQNYGCDCVSPTKASQRMKQYAQDIWSAYNTTHPELPRSVAEKFLNHPSERTKAKREHAHGTLMYKLFEKYPAVIDKISNDGQSSRDHPSHFEVPKQVGDGSGEL